jgi:hypothetical protein
VNNVKWVVELFVPHSRHDSLKNKRRYSSASIGIQGSDSPSVKFTNWILFAAQQARYD